MTALELNAQIWRNMAEIADNESMLIRVAKYLRKLVKEQQEDPTLMSREEFFAKLKRGEEAFRRGESTRLMEGESVTDMLRRTGYAL